MIDNLYDFPLPNSLFEIVDEQVNTAANVSFALFKQSELLYGVKIDIMLRKMFKNFYGFSANGQKGKYEVDSCSVKIDIGSGFNTGHLVPKQPERLLITNAQFIVTFGNSGQFSFKPGDTNKISCQ